LSRNSSAISINILETITSLLVKGFVYELGVTKHFGLSLSEEKIKGS
jgi:hypothetical protein